jgi:hypothetical protein
MTKSEFKTLLIYWESILTQLIEESIQEYGSRKLAAKIGKPHNYFTLAMKEIKKEKYLTRKVKKLLECAGSIYFPQLPEKSQKKPPINAV